MNFSLSHLLKALPEKDRQRAVAVLLILLAVSLWTWNLAPALKTWREVPPQLMQLELQTQGLKAMQAQAQVLQKSPRMTSADAAVALQRNATEILGGAGRLQMDGARATLTLQGVTPDALAQFLGSARTQAQALPVEAHLQKFSSAAPKANELWRGTLIFNLPGG